MVPLEYKGGAATGATEVIVIGILALAIIALGLLLMRSMKRIQVPYADEIPHEPAPSAEDVAAAEASDRDRPHADGREPDGDRRV